MPDTLLALDFGVYTWPLVQGQLNEAALLGYELVVIGAWHGQSTNRYRRQQAEMVAATGMDIASYNLIGPPSWTPLPPAQQITVSLWTDALFIAVDAEVDITPDMLLEALTEARKHGRTCIYTGAWWWNFFILRYHDWFYAHPDAFANEPSWLADYDWLPELDTQRLAHLGPVIGKQFKGSTSEVAGINADLNVFDRAWLFDEEEEDVTYYPLLAQPEGRKEVYQLVGDTLTHVPNPEDFVLVGFSWDKVQKFPVTHPIWKKRTVYPAGVPITLLLPGLS